MVRSEDGGSEHVLVVGGLAGLATGVRRGRRRRGRIRGAESEGAPDVPITRLTVIRPGALESRGRAEAWLAEIRASHDRADELVAEAVGIVDRALHAHRLATQEPHGGGVSAGHALMTRVGYGTGDELADGRWRDAVDVPAPRGPRSRTEALRPQERLAAILGRREPVDACETLVLRARSDMDGDRTREAALQLRVALEALLAEVRPQPTLAAAGPGTLQSDQAARQLADLEELTERRRVTGEAANEALQGELSRARTEELEATLRRCERVLRRRRIMSAE